MKIESLYPHKSLYSTIITSRLSVGLFGALTYALIKYAKDADNIIAASGVYLRLQGLVFALDVALLIMTHNVQSELQTQGEHKKIAAVFQHISKASIIFSTLLALTTGLVCARPRFLQSTFSLDVNQSALAAHFLLSMLPSLPLHAFNEAIANTMLSKKRPYFYIGTHALRAGLAFLFSSVSLLVFNWSTLGLGASTTAGFFFADIISVFIAKQSKPSTLNSTDDNIFADFLKSICPTCQPINDVDVKAELKRFYHAGIPIGIGMLMELLSHTAFTARVKALGTPEQYQAYAISDQWSVLAIFMLFALQRVLRVKSATIIGHRQDTQDNRTIKQKLQNTLCKAQRTSAIFSVSYAGLMTILSFTGSAISVYYANDGTLNSEAVLKAGRLAIPLTTAFTIFYGIRLNEEAYLTAIRDHGFLYTGPLAILACYLITLIPAVAKLGFNGVLIMQGLGAILPALILIARRCTINTDAKLDKIYSLASSSSIL